MLSSTVDAPLDLAVRVGHPTLETTVEIRYSGRDGSLSERDLTIAICERFELSAQTISLMVVLDGVVSEAPTFFNVHSIGDYVLLPVARSSNQILVRVYGGRDAIISLSISDSCPLTMKDFLKKSIIGTKKVMIKQLDMSMLVDRDLLRMPCSDALGFIKEVDPINAPHSRQLSIIVGDPDLPISLNVPMTQSNQVSGLQLQEILLNQFNLPQSIRVMTDRQRPLPMFIGLDRIAGLRLLVTPPPGSKSLCVRVFTKDKAMNDIQIVPVDGPRSMTVKKLVRNNISGCVSIRPIHVSSPTHTIKSHLKMKVYDYLAMVETDLGFVIMCEVDPLNTQYRYNVRLNTGLFKDPLNYLPLLRQWIDQCSKLSQESSIRGPYFPICQSSGSGKTKLVLQLPLQCHGQQGTYWLLHIVCRNAQAMLQSPVVTKLHKKLAKVKDDLTVYELSSEQRAFQIAERTFINQQRKAFQSKCQTFPSTDPLDAENVAADSEEFKVLEILTQYAYDMFLRLLCYISYWSQKGVKEQDLAARFKFAETQSQSLLVFEEWKAILSNKDYGPKKKKPHEILDSIKGRKKVVFCWDEACGLFVEERVDWSHAMVFRAVRRAACRIAWELGGKG